MHNEYNGKSFVSWQQLFMFFTLINTDVDFETIFLQNTVINQPLTGRVLRNKNNRLCKCFLYADVNLEKILLGKSFIKLQESVSITSLLSTVVKTHCYPSLSIEGGFFASTRKTQTFPNISVNAYSLWYNWSPARLFLPWLVSMYTVCAQCGFNVPCIL